MMRINNMKLKQQKTLSFVFIFMLAFIFMFQADNNLFTVGNVGTDSSVFQYVARIILNGGMPYRDTFDHKGPLLYLFNVAGVIIAEWRGIWVIEYITILTSFLFIYKIARLKCTRAYSLIVLTITSSALFKYFESGNLTEEYAMPFIAASIYIFADYFLNEKINKIRLIICGFSFAAVCLLRINMIAVWIVMCIAVLIHCIKAKKQKDLINFILFFIIGFLILVVPIFLWLIVKGAFLAFIDNYLVFNIFYSSNSQQANISAKFNAFNHFINEPLILFGICISVYLSIRKRDTFNISYLFLWVLTLISISLSGHIFMHYGMILVPLLAYPFSSIHNLFEDDEKIKKPLISIIMLCLLVSFALPKWIPATNTSLQEFYNQENAIDKTELQISDIIKNNTDPNDKIIVCGNWNIIYNLSDRFAASKYSYQTPICEIDKNKMNNFLNDLNAENPKAVVFKKDYFAYEDIVKFVKKYNYNKLWTNEDETIFVYIKN